MTNKQATRRYLGLVIPGAVLFLGVSVILRAADDAAMLPSSALYAVSILPVGMMLGMFWAQWRYMNEIDEFLRSIQLKAVFAGLIVTMTAATGWGWLEFYAEASPLPVFWLNPLYWIGYSIAVLVFAPRDGGQS